MTRSAHTAVRLYTVLATLLLALGWVATAAPPVKLTIEVANPSDLTAELHVLLTVVEQGTASPESYSERQGQLKRVAVQMAIFAQALAEHDAETPQKKSAPSLRNAAIGLSRAASFEEAAAVLPRLKEAMEGKPSGTPAVEVEWGKLARASTMMGAMKERSESIRRAIRRPKDPDSESRHAMAIALMALVVHGDMQAVKNPADVSSWQDSCLELQQHMSRTSAAIKSKDGTAADHFRMGMEACDKCHLKFKP